MFDTLKSKQAELAETRRLILAYGWNTTSYQILNPGFNRWFSREGDAVIGWTLAAGVRVVAGAPVCTMERLAALVREFESEAARARQRVCYVAAEARLEAALKDSERHSRVLLGAQPVWDPSNWSAIVARDKSLRAQINRARNKGLSVKEWSREQAFENPELETVLQAWLADKGLPPLHFLVEPDTLSRIFDRRIFVATGPNGVAGFLLISPIATRRGWLFEQFIHRPGSPNGTVEMLIDAAMRALARDGFEFATLGLSPLSHRARIERFLNPLWLRTILRLIRRYGQPLYNFDGLDAFKNKLRPDSWEPIYAIYNRPQFTPRPLYAVASAFSRKRPIRLFAGGLARLPLYLAKRAKRYVSRRS